MGTTTEIPSKNSENMDFMPNLSSAFSFDFDTAKENALYFSKNFLSLFTIVNITILFKFLTIVVVALFTFLTKAIPWLGEFTIRLVHELAYLIHVCMPLFLAFIELIQKTIGGFYILIAMLWRGQPDNRQIIRPRNYYNQPPQYNRRSPNQYPFRQQNQSQW